MDRSYDENNTIVFLGSGNKVAGLKYKKRKTEMNNDFEFEPYEMCSPKQFMKACKTMEMSNRVTSAGKRILIFLIYAAIILTLTYVMLYVLEDLI